MFFHRYRGFQSEPKRTGGATIPADPEVKSLLLKNQLGSSAFNHTTCAPPRRFFLKCLFSANIRACWSSTESGKEIKREGEGVRKVQLLTAQIRGGFLCFYKAHRDLTAFRTQDLRLNAAYPDEKKKKNLNFLK